MPIIIAVLIYSILFISGTAISHNIPKSVTTPSPIPEFLVLSASTSVSTPSTTQIPDSPTPTIQVTKMNKVTKVIDGDTIQVDIAGKTETIRLIGIDSPETVDPRKPVQCFGKEASNKAKELLSGKNVTLEEDLTQGERDKYNRLLRYVFLADGTNVNKLMIHDGFAHEYTYQSNPYKYQDEFKKAEKEARETKMGLWADNVCATPTPTIRPTSTPVKLTITPTSVIYVPPPVIQQITTQAPTSGYICNCSKVCGAMSSCEEAYFQLNQCGCSVRDGDKDGVPCESICN